MAHYTAKVSPQHPSIFHFEPNDRTADFSSLLANSYARCHWKYSNRATKWDKQTGDPHQTRWGWHQLMIAERTEVIYFKEGATVKPDSECTAHVSETLLWQRFKNKGNEVNEHVCTWPLAYATMQTTVNRIQLQSVSIPVIMHCPWIKHSNCHTANYSYCTSSSKYFILLIAFEKLFLVFFTFI